MADKHKVRIIKFGGACITKKDKFETFNEEGIKWCVETIEQMQENNDPIIIVCGAGSFGHHQAKKYELVKGETTLNYGEQDQEKILSRKKTNGTWNG